MRNQSQVFLRVRSSSPYLPSRFLRPYRRQNGFLEIGKPNSLIILPRSKPQLMGLCHHLNHEHIIYHREFLVRKDLNPNRRQQVPHLSDRKSLRFHRRHRNQNDRHSCRHFCCEAIAFCDFKHFSNASTGPGPNGASLVALSSSRSLLIRNKVNRSANRSSLRASTSF